MSRAALQAEVETAWDRFIRHDQQGMAELQLVVPDMHCAGCLAKVERGLKSLEGVRDARANLSTKRVAVRWADDAPLAPPVIIERLKASGFEATPFDQRLAKAADKSRDAQLLRAMAVAGFAAANIMLLSVSVWAGLVSDMDVATRGLFYWLSALIALPTVAYAGRPFFLSARRALKARSMNMDVPISLAVLLTTGVSLFETIRGAEHVYFDASVSLLFFLLIGRYLDSRMRAKACEAAENLLGLRASAATLVLPDGAHRSIALEDIKIGDKVLVAAGMRVPVDGRVLSGASDIDQSLITGESLPVTVKKGGQVFAGTLNMTGPLMLAASAEDKDSLLAEIVRLMEAAEQGRAGYVRLADRLARLYAPLVHVLALATFIGWLLAGGGWHPAMMAAVATLIITCPCALGLAVPVVQVVASGRLMRQGILVKSSDALERLADIDMVVFDKTGTLTLGDLELANVAEIPPADLALAQAMARQSRHPLAQAVARAATAPDLPAIEAAREIAGAGIEARLGGARLRLGRADWVGGAEEDVSAAPALWLRRDARAPVAFRFNDRLRPDAAAVVARLKARGLKVALLSGDRRAAVAAQAAALGIEDFQAEQRPDDKIARLAAYKAEGRKVLMVGDGLNDAPALRAAYASISPAAASDIAQTAADVVFQGARLAAVEEALDTARRSRSLVKQNFGLALLYNAVAIPMAMAGMVTPLIAAVAMSGSSMIVTVNALRLKALGPRLDDAA